MPMKITPIAICNFPSISTNCLGFGIGNTTPVRESEELYVLDHHLPIAEAFLKKLTEMGYEDLPRQIQSVDEVKDGEYVIMVYDFTEYHVKNPFTGWETHWDYHVVRRELNGTWVHKPGWYDQPCEIHTEAEWEAIYDEFGHEYVLFAVA